MILVDTSVWVDFFRGRDRRLISHLQELLEHDQVALAAPVKIEILSGSSSKDRIALRRVLQALPLLVPTESTWTRMEEWTGQAVANGERFGVADLLIAGLAADSSITVWSHDADFERMEKLGFIDCHIPP